LTPQAIEQLCLVNQELDERRGATLRFDRHSCPGVPPRGTQELL